MSAPHRLASLIGILGLLLASASVDLADGSRSASSAPVAALAQAQPSGTPQPRQAAIAQGPLHPAPPARPDRLSAQSAEVGDPPLAGPEGVSVPGTELRGPEVAAQAAASLLVKRDTPFSLPEVVPAAFGRVNEPSVGSLDDVIFQTGNWYAAVSTDNGASFQFVDPDETFPRAPIEFSAGFCCDQRVAQHAARNLMFWYIQYNPPPGQSVSNGVRLAVAHGSGDVAANRWSYCDYLPSTFGFAAGTTLDFPHLQVGSNYVYFSSNVESAARQRIGAVIVRIPVATLDAGQCVAPEYAVVTTSGGFAPVHGATTRMVFASVASTSTLAITDWPESSPTPAFTSIAVAPSFANAFECVGPDGLDPCDNARARVMAGWLTSGELGFMWHSAGGGQDRPFPFVRVAILNPATLQVISQADIWSRSAAVLYPSVAANARGHLGGVVYAIGGSQFPTVYAMVRDDLVPAGAGAASWELHEIATSTNGSAEWGDFSGTTVHERFPNTWIGGAHVMIGGTTNTSVRPRNIWFMRPRDDPSTLPSPPTRTPTPSPTAGGVPGTATRTLTPTLTPAPAVSCAGVAGLGSTSAADASAGPERPPRAFGQSQPSGSSDTVGGSRPILHGVAEASMPPARARAAGGPGPGWTTVTCQTFESPVLGPGWHIFDNNAPFAGVHCWGTTSHQARFGLYSLWPAAGTACQEPLDPATSFYPDELDSWIVFGPFDLTDAQEADVHFSLWHQIARGTEEGGDRLFFGASTDATNFWGFFVTGNSTNREPPTTAGWRDLGFDLTNVPVLGNLAGQSRVYVAWVFQSDEEGVDDGPFLDDILVEKRVAASGTPATQVTRTPAATATPTPSPSAPATATPTPSVGGRNLGITTGPGGITLTWEPGNGQSGYVVARLSGQGVTVLPFGSTLSASATTLTDALPSTGPVCYAVIPLRGAMALPASDVLCMLAPTHSAVGAPRSFTLRLNESNLATLTWDHPTLGPPDSYVLVPFGKPPVLLDGQTTGASDLTAGPTCYTVLAVRAGLVPGNSDILCGLPRVPLVTPPS